MILRCGSLPVGKHQVQTVDCLFYAEASTVGLGYECAIVASCFNDFMGLISALTFLVVLSAESCMLMTMLIGVEFACTVSLAVPAVVIHVNKNSSKIIDCYFVAI